MNIKERILIVSLKLFAMNGQQLLIDYENHLSIPKSGKGEK